MKCKGAIAILKRSIEHRGLKYTKFIGNGDSSCFGKVLEAVKNVYDGSYPIEKEECVGHIQKGISCLFVHWWGEVHFCTKSLKLTATRACQYRLPVDFKCTTFSRQFSTCSELLLSTTRNSASPIFF